MKKAMKVLLSLIGFVGAVSGQREAESGSVIGAAQAINEASASGGAMLSLPSAGAGAEYASVETTPGPQSVTLKYRCSVQSSLQLYLQPNGGSISVQLPSTGGEWKVGTFPGITTTDTPVNFTLILTGMGTVDVDTWEVCVVDPCVGCGLSVYNESLPTLDGPPVPPMMSVESPPVPGYVPPPPFELWGPRDNPFIPNPSGSTTSGVVMTTKWNISLSFPASVQVQRGTCMEISNFTWSALAGGGCEWACMLGCTPAVPCEVGVRMTVKLHLSPHLERNNTTLVDHQGTTIVTEGGTVALASAASSPCGTAAKRSVQILMVGPMYATPLVNLAFTCGNCVQL